MTTQTLDDLVRSVPGVEVEAALLDAYPHEAAHVRRFRSVYERLLASRPVPSRLVLRLEWCEDEHERWLSVYGEDGTLRDDGEPEGFALELMAWAEWLGIAVPEELRRGFRDVEIVAHCLSEMTTVAFEEGAVQAQRREIERRARRWEEMTPEEREEHSIPWEEVEARLERRLGER